MSHFMFLSDIAGPRWVIMGIVVKLAQSVSLSHSLPHLMSNLDSNRLDYVSDLAHQDDVIAVLTRNCRTDRDSGRWKLEKDKTQKRRELFYELLTYDSWQVCSYFCLFPVINSFRFFI